MIIDRGTHFGTIFSTCKEGGGYLQKRQYNERTNFYKINTSEWMTLIPMCSNLSDSNFYDWQLDAYSYEKCDTGSPIRSPTRTSTKSSHGGKDGWTYAIKRYLLPTRE